MPLMRGGRPLKAWTWVGAFGPELMLCAARVRVGVIPAAWWAVWDRASGRMVERSARGAGGVEVSRTHLRIRGRAVRAELALGEGAPVEVVSPHGREYIWTRKQGGVRVRGSVSVADRRHEIDAAGVVDESAGYHARNTSWMWSAGVGVAESGAAVAWNLVTGVHDEPGASERTVWVDGAPQHVGPVVFEGLDGIRGDGVALAFEAEATRAHSENLWLLASSYEQPFGTFAGELPGAGRLREGYGVMERHDVRW
jgi:hypothetical protein